MTFRAGDAAGEDYVRRCFHEYGFSTDPSGRYSAMYKPYHAIGLELGISVASVGLRREPTGAADRLERRRRRDREARSHGRRDARRRRRLHGVRQAAAGGALARLGGLPLGLAHGIRLVRPVAAHEPCAGTTSSSTPRTTPSGSGGRWKPGKASASLERRRRARLQAARLKVASSAPAATNSPPKVRFTQRTWCGAERARSVRAAKAV